MGEARHQHRNPDRTATFRGLSAMLLAAVAVLVGTTLYLVVRDRMDIWTAARNNTRAISVASQASISGLLAQSTSSLLGIRADMRDTAAGRDAPPLLRDAMRFDPLSAYLGVRWADGRVAAVDHLGRPVPPAVAAALGSLIAWPTSGGFEVSQLVQLPGDANWYMPLTLALDDGAAAAPPADAVFALVPGPSLVAGAKDVYPASDAFVAILSQDGRRLVKYLGASASFQFNGPPIRAESMAWMRAADTGNFETESSLDGQRAIFGFAKSPSLPLIMITGVPVATLNAEWARQSVSPTVLLLLGVGAIVLFGFRLRASLRAQWAYLGKQEYLANHDTLTGLRNRDSFVRLLQHEIARSPAGTLAVLVMDLNNFKDVNDTLGHAAGDRLLIELGRRLQDCVGADGAAVARLGGDEMAVFIRRADGDVALAGFAAQLQQCMSRRIRIDGVDLEPTVTMGGAVYPPDAQTHSELMRCADIAMYVAKETRLPFAQYSETMDSFSPDRLAMKAELARAIREGALHLVYQPKVRLGDGALVGCEALARWVDPVKGPIPPMSFVPIAEGSELIHPFTDYVLRTALAQIRAWRERGHDVPVAVNISANNLLDERFTGRVAELLAEHGVPPRLLELEVTESAVMRNPETVVRHLHALRGLGVRLSIDDYGTGHASLAYLKHLPVHTLKIDKAFIAGLDTDAADRRIVASAILLARGFGMTVVAEGVETAAVTDVLRGLACDCAQGYHFARPLSAVDIEAAWFGRHAGADVATEGCGGDRPADGGEGGT